MLFAGRVSLRAPSLRKPCVVLDLDETLLWRPRGAIDAVALYCGFAVGEAYPGALHALAELSRSYALVAVTARWSVAERGTAAWLGAHGLGHVPVVYASHARPRDASRVAYKAAAIARLRDEGWAPLLGIGDRPSDLRAYAAAGLPALMVAHAQGGGAAEALRSLGLGEGAGSVGSSGAVIGSGASASSVRCVTDDAEVHARPASAGLAAGLLHQPAGPLVPVWTQIAQSSLVRDLIDGHAQSRLGGWRG